MICLADEHGDKKVNFWEAPTNVSSWKEEQVIYLLSSHGVLPLPYSLAP